MLCLAFSFITPLSNAQEIAGTIDQTTGNLINNNAWSGVGAYAPDPNNCCSNPAGSQPLYDTNTGIIKFSYGQATVQQSIAINQALTAAGSGIQVKGYSWGYDLRNMNGKGGQGGTDSLTVNTWLTNSSGQSVAGTTHVYNTPFDWTSYAGTQTLPSSVVPSTLGNVGISFTGRDNGFWAGLYGPEVRNVSLRVNYGVDPCATNPAYSPNCAGFNNVLTSNNLVPNPNAYAYGGSTINNSYAINTALASAGSGAQIHGFNWGYVANANGTRCDSYVLGLAFLGCDGWVTPSATTNVNITSSTGASLYNVSRTYTNSYNTTNYSYLFPTSQTMSTLGNFNFTGSTNDQAYIGSMWSTAIYTVDPCVANPLYSPTCSGYGAAYAKLLSSTSTTSSTSTAYVGVSSTTTSSQVETSPAGVIDQTNPQTTTTTASTSLSSTSSSSTSSSSTTTQDTSQPTATAQADVAQPASTTPAPAGGPPATTTASSTSTSSSSQSSSKAGPSALAMSVVNQAKERDQATQRMAVQNAAKAVEASTQQSNAATASAISMVQDMSANSATASAQFTSQASQASVQAGQQMQQAQQSTGQTATAQTQARTTQTTQQVQTYTQQQVTVETNSSVTLKAPTIVMVDTIQASSGTGLSIGRISNFGFSLNSSANSGSMPVETAPAQTYQFRTDPKQFEVETPQPQVASFGGVGKAGNPLSEMMMQQRFELLQASIDQQKGSVNRNVQPNEAAGGVDLRAMAVVPAGFNAYSFVMRDAAFYEPKEVYKNQRTVDNVRLLRGLTGGSDAKHKEMVDSQYK